MRARGPMTAIAMAYLARADLQPVAMCREQASAIDVQHGNEERDIGRYAHRHRPIRLDGCITENLPHETDIAAHSGVEVDVGEAEIFIADGHRLLQTQESRRPLCRVAQPRISDGGDIYSTGVGDDTVEVVDAADVEQADAFTNQCWIEVRRGLRVVGTERRWHARLRGNQIRNHDAFHRLEQRLEGVVGRVEYESAVKRGCGLHIRIRQPLRGARHYARGRDGLIEQPALRPAHENAVAAVP